MWWRIRAVGRFLYRLWKWMPVLWKDEDWDDSYLLRIMKHKLSMMRKQIQANNRHTTCQQTCEEIRLAELYLDRLVNDYFPHGNDYFCTCPDNHFIDKPDGSKDIIFCPACREFLGLLKSQRIKRKKNKKLPYGKDPETHCYNLFWDHMKKHSNKWWD